MNPPPPVDSYERIFDARGHLYNEAGSKCPGAREAERSALISRLELSPGLVVCDLPAGGGYLADGIHAVWQDTVEVICVEPAKRFATAIATHFKLRHDALDMLSLENETVDRMASLAGLHHIMDRVPCYREWHRVLRPGGIVALADVQEGTATGKFLNGFVDRHTPGGHDGKFFVPGELERELGEAGFTDVREELVQVPWIFPDEQTMKHFCKTLFALESATADEVLEGIRECLGWSISPDGQIRMNWELRYACGRKP